MGAKQMPAKLALLLLCVHWSENRKQRRGKEEGEKEEAKEEGKLVGSIMQPLDVSPIATGGLYACTLHQTCKLYTQSIWLNQDTANSLTSVAYDVCLLSVINPTGVLAYRSHAPAQEHPRRMLSAAGQEPQSILTLQSEAEIVLVDVVVF